MRKQFFKQIVLFKMASKEEDSSEWEKCKKELLRSSKENLKEKNRFLKDFGREFFTKRLSDEEFLAFGMDDMVGVHDAADWINLGERLELDFNLNQGPNKI